MVFDKATNKQKIAIYGFFALVLILILIGITNAQNTYKPGDTYTKTFYVTSNESVIQTNKLQVYLVQAISLQLSPLYYKFQKYPENLTIGQIIPITVTWTIPQNAQDGTYIATAIISVLDFINNKPYSAGYAEEVFYIISGPITTTTTTTTTTPITTTTTPTTTTTIQECPILPIGSLCPDGKTFCPTGFDINDCKILRCDLCPQQPQPNYLLYAGLIIAIVIIISFVILKKYK